MSTSATSATIKENKERKCLLMLKLKQEYPLPGRHRSFTKHSLACSQNKCFIYLDNKGPKNNCAHPEFGKQMASPNRFPSKPMTECLQKHNLHIRWQAARASVTSLKQSLLPANSFSQKSFPAAH